MFAKLLRSREQIYFHSGVIKLVYHSTLELLQSDKNVSHGLEGRFVS
jgi:hypothetical protein